MITVEAEPVCFNQARTVPQNELYRLLGPLNLQRYGRKAVAVINASTVAVSGVVVRVNPDWRAVEDPYLSGADAEPSATVWVQHLNLGAFAPGETKYVALDAAAFRWYDIAVWCSNVMPDSEALVGVFTVATI